MKAYYQEHREEAIGRATRWAKQNPKRKQEINKASNMRRHGTRSVQYYTPEDAKHSWSEFLYRHEHASPDERDELCADFICTAAAAVITIPAEIEDILAEWEERTEGNNINA
jgi:FMN phosphatase YigB (HAD superfamily)